MSKIIEYPVFSPALTPRQMLELGVFEGKYLNSTRSEYPSNWFLFAKLSPTPNPGINAFGKKSRQSLGQWRANGWINEQDPLGWFQWYCRYFQGRRSQDDIRQIKRHRAFVRHSAQVLKHGGSDPKIRVIQRQALLQWAHDPFPDVQTRPGCNTFQKCREILNLE